MAFLSRFDELEVMHGALQPMRVDQILVEDPSAISIDVASRGLRACDPDLLHHAAFASARCAR